MRSATSFITMRARKDAPRIFVLREGDSRNDPQLRSYTTRGAEPMNRSETAERRSSLYVEEHTRACPAYGACQCGHMP